MAVDCMDLISQVFRNLQSEGLEMLLSHDAWRQRPMLALGSKPGTRMALPLDMTTSSASDLSSSTRTARSKQEWAEKEGCVLLLRVNGLCMFRWLRERPLE